MKKILMAICFFIIPHSSFLIPHSLAATFPVRMIPQEDEVLEPSIQNEVDHAIDRGEAWLAASQLTNRLERVQDLFSTNALTREKIALKLISSQKGEGWWVTPTNAAPTRLALEILKGL